MDTFGKCKLVFQIQIQIHYYFISFVEFHFLLSASYLSKELIPS